MKGTFGGTNVQGLSMTIEVEDRDPGAVKKRADQIASEQQLTNLVCLQITHYNGTPVSKRSLKKHGLG